MRPRLQSHSRRTSRQQAILNTIKTRRYPISKAARIAIPIIKIQTFL